MQNSFRLYLKDIYARLLGFKTLSKRRNQKFPELLPTELTFFTGLRGLPDVLKYIFSHSLIIHVPNFQSDCWVWAMFIEFDTQ